MGNAIECPNCKRDYIIDEFEECPECHELYCWVCFESGICLPCLNKRNNK